jgi:hypothetical protein
MRSAAFQRGPGTGLFDVSYSDILPGGKSLVGDHVVGYLPFGKSFTANLGRVFVLDGEGIKCAAGSIYQGEYSSGRYGNQAAVTQNYIDLLVEYEEPFRDGNGIVEIIFGVGMSDSNAPAGHYVAMRDVRIELIRI